jgi:hypothetical protein
MVGQELGTDLMPLQHMQPAFDTNELQVLGYTERPMIKQHMMVRAEAQDIGRDVGARMWTTKGLYVSRLRV